MASIPDSSSPTSSFGPNFVVQPASPNIGNAGTDDVVDASNFLVLNAPASPVVAKQAPRTLEERSLEKYRPIHPALQPLPTRQVWGVDFSAVTMEQALDRIDVLVFRHVPSFVVTANLNYVMLCRESVNLPVVTREAEIVLCDGMPILWRSKLDSESLPERVAGSDLIYKLCERAAFRGHRLYFLGAAEGIAQKAADQLKSLYPGLIVAGVDCPPFRKWDDADCESINSKIVAAKPDILLVAFGQPKGEFWIHENYKKLNVPVSIQLGATFDFVAGTAPRAPKILQMIGFEWLYRAACQPKRLIPRYWKNLKFLLKTIRQEITESASQD